ncbi:bifunctional 2-C-methyl-D-erythritol 4-phosphate cytidylyltransferase/2-C-methyl-D-erythritol 2,4-cyclodiphosphate synthase [Cognatiyoonia koreensis]|nr:bifunctional 2-C-methyl-D-erythritol 4-phosphate cytidylyltransferase/2-C-methyl-D-erythritol 2,4-cyclodiphosphate synthase [Cognatiyoonia koreensis]
MTSNFKQPHIVAILVAAGKGERAGGNVPKQWQLLHGKTVLEHSLKSLSSSCQTTVVVLNENDLVRWNETGLAADIVVTGGETRDASVRAGLDALADHNPDYVLIHDAARPLVSQTVIANVIAALDHHDGAAPAVPVVDALWTGQDRIVTGTQDRTGLFRAQTPQGFRYAVIRDAHAAHAGTAADDVEVARAAGLTVAIVPGDEDNIKITGPDDLARATRLMEQTMDIRLGNGYDVHRFGPGDHVWLCGIKVPHERGLQGHSDADVGMHAVTDAIYGALGMGDIGQHFPPSDPQWKGARSEIFLRHAVELASEQGFSVSNVDCTLVCEYPKIGPHQPAMKAALADIIGISADRISVKATTSEQLGFTGRGEGIASLATATLVKP